SLLGCLLTPLLRCLLPSLLRHEQKLLGPIGPWFVRRHRRVSHDIRGDFGGISSSLSHNCGDFSKTHPRRRRGAAAARLAAASIVAARSRRDPVTTVRQPSPETQK